LVLVNSSNSECYLLFSCSCLSLLRPQPAFDHRSASAYDKLLAVPDPRLFFTNGLPQPLTNPSPFLTSEAKVSFLCSLLSGEALEWLSALWTRGSVPFYSYAAFTQLLRQVFHHSADGKEPGDLLMETEDTYLQDPIKD
uniref:DUF4939 domain-containing protein n=1 Tax=Oryzias melastigma TaxID=30732 RepID=A0A3B3BWQ6_ORYME